MSKFILSFFTLFTVLFAKGQQKAQYTQYMANQYILNPALAGSEKFLDIKLGFRKQWLGFQGGPLSYYASIHMPVGRNPDIVRNKKTNWHGIGGYFYNDITGPTTRTGANFSYSFNLALSSNWRLALGAFAGFQQFKVNGENFVLYDEDDQVLNGIHRSTVPDITLGSWLYSSNFYWGLSLHQILQNKLDIVPINDSGINSSRLAMHILSTCGYAFKTKSMIFTPSLMVKYVTPAPLSVDINLKISYKEGLLWWGTSYRLKDSFSFIGGISLLNGTLPISYSYDLTTSGLFKHHTGTHEIVVGYRFQKSKMYCPANFW